MTVLELKHVSKVYGGKVQTQALADVQLTVQKGEFVGIMGPSGSGKTTLLNIISTIDSHSSGEVWIEGKNPYQLKKEDLALFRRRHFGFVFQEYHLLDTLTIAENIVLPLTLDNQNLALMEKRLQEVAEILEIVDILEKRTFEVSGGEKQRAAIARAMVHSPSLILADEPTGALDSRASRRVMEMLEKINRKEKVTILLVTHDPLAASYCNRVIFIKDGRLYNEIHRGESRSSFYQQIIDMLSFLGGEQHDLSSVRH